MRRFALLLIASVAPASAGPPADSLPVTLELTTATVGGTLLLPPASRPSPCIVLVGGTLSQLRDGEIDRDGVPPRTAMKRLAESLAEAGYASFRYDQVGHGASRAKAGYSHLYEGDARVLADIYAHLRGRSECTKIIAAGESAGAYVASLAARAGAHADGYIFLGGFCGKAEEIFSYNFGRLADYVAKSADRAAWANANHLHRDLAFGRRWRDMFAAAHARKDSFDVVDGSFKQVVKLARRIEEIDNPPDDMFSYIKAPALALAGARDLNVAPHHAAAAAAIMQRAGNLRAKAVLIDGADHNFQVAPDDADLAFRERYTFASFNRPYHPALDREILAWLAAPERVELAPGVTIIDNILDRSKLVGVDTLEGFIGPLLRVPEMRAHFIDMPAGLYLDEHPHAKGSIIYTARGTWALKSRNRWHLMKPGSLYWFGDNVPTGFQVPFKEDAYILIFKSAPGDDDAAFVAYLRKMAEGLRKEQAAGEEVFRLTELPPGHPALDYARKVNPAFDRDFPRQQK